ncbi:hypothetical protein PIB30_024493, partial [Stylosanthes scabra]|nr:hypothetical protein [Stylosanthes scabra]
RGKAGLCSRNTYMPLHARHLSPPCHHAPGVFLCAAPPHQWRVAWKTGKAEGISASLLPGKRERLEEFLLLCTARLVTSSHLAPGVVQHATGVLAQPPCQVHNGV